MLMLPSAAALPSCALLYGALYCAMLKSQCLSLSVSRPDFSCLTVMPYRGIAI